MWDPPGPGIKPRSPALAGRFFTTEPPVKPSVYFFVLTQVKGFPSGSVVKNLPANTEDVGWIPGSGRLPRGGNGNPLQYSCLGNPINRGTWWATAYGVSKSQTWLSDWACTQNSWFISVNFCCTTKCFSYFIYIISFKILFSIMVYHRILNIIPCAKYTVAACYLSSLYIKA